MSLGFSVLVLVLAWCYPRLALIVSYACSIIVCYAESAAALGGTVAPDCFQSGALSLFYVALTGLWASVCVTLALRSHGAQMRREGDGGDAAGARWVGEGEPVSQLLVGFLFLVFDTPAILSEKFGTLGILARWRCERKKRRIFTRG